VTTNGKHLVLDLYGCKNPLLLGSLNLLEDTLALAATKAGANIITMFSHEFKCRDTGDSAWSVLWVLEESHISAHVWPKERYVALDMYTCGDADPMKSLDYILDCFIPDDYKLTFLHRGDALWQMMM